MGTPSLHAHTSSLSLDSSFSIWVEQKCRQIHSITPSSTFAQRTDKGYYDYSNKTVDFCASKDNNEWASLVFLSRNILQDEKKK